MRNSSLVSSAPTFHKPDIDQADLTPNKLVDYHLKHNPNYPTAILADISGRDHENELITWHEVGTAICRAAGTLRASWLLEKVTATREPLVIAILAAGDPLSYFVVLLAIMRLGHIPLAISPRNSAAAISHLLEETKCRHVLVQFDPKQLPRPTEALDRQQVADFIDLLPEQHDIRLNKFPTAHELFPRLLTGDPYEVPTVDFKFPEWLQSIEAEDQVPWRTLLILHSSGTTKFPKAVYKSQSTFKSGLNLHKYSKFNWNKQITSAMALPPFHSMAFHVGFFPVLYEGTVSAFFRPSVSDDGNYQMPNINSITIMAGLCKAGCTLGVFSPATLVEYAEDAGCVEFLKGMERVAFGGGPLRPDIGNIFAARGVKLTSVYGLTEAGCVVNLFSQPFDPATWEYFEFSPHITPELVPYGRDTYELFIKSSSLHRCSMTFVDRNQAPHTFKTNDLLEKHPSLPLYRVVGRVDDQIMLSNAEKTNPGPLEAILCCNPAVQAALMFGRGKAQNGVLIEPAPGFEVDCTTPKQVDSYLNRIWSSVEELNKFAPSHSRITRDLILVTDPRVSPLPRTLKGAVARAKALEMFEKRIELLYTKGERAVPVGLSIDPHDLLDSKGRLSIEKLCLVVKLLVEDLIGRSLDQSVDLFKQGCDSLHATQIRSKLTTLLQKVLKVTVSVPQSIVYQQPTIKHLSIWLADMMSRSDHQENLAIESDSPATVSRIALENLKAMITKYTSHPKVVLITGTTGSLGAHVLGNVLRQQGVTNVFALNREPADAQKPMQRHLAAFQERGLDVSVLEDPRLTFLTTNRVSYLNQTLRNLLSSTITHVLHLSYPVNFNLNLGGFAESIEFTQELTQLFKQSVFSPRSSSVGRPTFLFASSVATLASYEAPEEEWVDEKDVALSSCLGSGYGESKRVCEKIIEAYGQEYGYNSVILRIAQLCGSRINGAWNKHEWFPLLVQSGMELGCLPDGNDDIAWIPVDEAAKALVDLALFERSGSSSQIIHRHLVHPKPTSWHLIIQQMAQKITETRNASRASLPLNPVRLVSYREWIDELTRKSQDPQADEILGSLGAIKLLDHFRNQGGHSGLHQKRQKGFEAMGVRRLVTTQSEAESPHLNQCPALSQRDALLWFEYWKTRGLFR